MNIELSKSGKRAVELMVKYNALMNEMKVYAGEANCEGYNEPISYIRSKASEACLDAFAEALEEEKEQ